jgi:tetratricopeptide (TPR) repeat protein
LKQNRPFRSTRKGIQTLVILRLKSGAHGLAWKSGRAAFIGAVAGLAIGSSPVVAEETASVRACDVSTAIPGDPQRPEGIAGVTDGNINVASALPACEAAVAAAPENLRVLSELARIFYLSKQYEKARALYVEAADKGYSYAQFQVGLFYVDGLGGFPKDERKAAHYFKLAVDQGNAWAESLLAGLYLQGHGVAQDAREGARLLSQAAEQGLPVAQYLIGRLYETGVGVPRDYTQAATWYRKAADQGNSDAKKALAELGDANDTKEIKLACEDKTFVFIHPDNKYVKLQDEAFVMEFKDGAIGDVLTGGPDGTADIRKYARGAVPGTGLTPTSLKQFVFIGENVIRFGAASKDIPYKIEYRIDRRSGLMTKDDDPPKQCSVLPSTRQF